MACVAGGFDGCEAEVAEVEAIAIVEEVNAMGGDGDHFAPEAVHGVAVDACCAGDEFGGVDEVLCAELVDVDGCAMLGEQASCARVIEVDVCDEGVLDVLGLKAMLCQACDEVVIGGGGACFDEDGAGWG